MQVSAFWATRSVKHSRLTWLLDAKFKVLGMTLEQSDTDDTTPRWLLRCSYKKKFSLLGAVTVLAANFAANLAAKTFAAWSKIIQICSKNTTRMQRGCSEGKATIGNDTKTDHVARMVANRICSSPNHSIGSHTSYSFDYKSGVTPHAPFCWKWHHTANSILSCHHIPKMSACSWQALEILFTLHSSLFAPFGLQDALETLPNAQSSPAFKFRSRTWREDSRVIFKGNEKYSWT